MDVCAGLELVVALLVCIFDSEEVGDGLCNIIELLGVRVPVCVEDAFIDDVLDPDLDKDTTCMVIISKMTCHSRIMQIICPHIHWSRFESLTS